MPISDKQMDILAFPFTDYKALICDGAIRTGKTVFMTMAFVDDAMRRYNHCRFGIAGKTVGSAHKNIIVPFMSIKAMREKYQIRFNRADNIMIVKNKKGHENTFELFGGKDESSYMLIQGRTLAGLFCDEVALLTRSFVEQAIARCSVEGSKLYFNCNPSSPDHWFYLEWVKRAKERNALHLHFLLDDNPSLSEDTKQLYSQFSGVFYQRYVLGLWVQAEGAIYKTFAEHEDEFMIDVNDAIDKARTARYICIGQDFGGHKSKHTFCCTAILDDMSLLVLGSEEYDATNTTTEFVVNALDTFAKKMMQIYGISSIDYVFADSAEQTIINTERDRLDYNIRNSIKNAINDRISAEDLLFTTRRIKLVKSTNESLISALKSAVWDEKAKEDVRLDNPGQTNICPLDAFEYSWELWIQQLIRI